MISRNLKFDRMTNFFFRFHRSDQNQRYFLVFTIYIFDDLIKLATKIEIHALYNASLTLTQVLHGGTDIRSKR